MDAIIEYAVPSSNSARSVGKPIVLKLSRGSLDAGLRLDKRRGIRPGCITQRFSRGAALRPMEPALQPEAHFAGQTG